jgi:hypothetical protein
VSVNTNKNLSSVIFRGLLLGSCLGLLWACEEPRPRSYTEYLGDDVGREATLTRCNADRAATMDDLECKNARRAAGALAAQTEAQGRDRLEAESDRKRAAARERVAAQQEAARRAAEAAQAELEEQALYGGTKLDSLPAAADANPDATRDDSLSDQQPATDLTQVGDDPVGAPVAPVPEPVQNNALPAAIPSPPATQVRPAQGVSVLPPPPEFPQATDGPVVAPPRLEGMSPPDAG